MSIFKSGDVVVETPESLSAALTQAEVAREAAIREAELIYGAEKAYVFEQAWARIRANAALIAELDEEQAKLQDILFPAGTDSLDEQA